MRQTRRSRSAVTPQKEDPAQVEESKADKTVKSNLEVVFEKEGDNGEEVGAPVETNMEEMQTSEEAAVGSAEVDQAVDAEPSTEKPPEASPAKASESPKKADSGVVELNCKVCNCSFTNYQEHMNSDAHKSKISHPSPNADKPVGQALKRSADQEAASSPKRMKSQNAQNAASEKFHCDVCKLTMTKQQDFDHHMNGKRHMMNVTRAQGKAYCDICKLFFNSLSDLNDHCESQLHKTTAAERKQDRQPFECTVCKLTSYGQKQHEQHLTSKRHKKALERPAGGAPATAAPATASAAATNVVNGKVETKANVTNRKWLYLCNACNFGSNQDQEFSGHMNLAEHKAAVIDMKKKGLVQEKGAPSKPSSAPKAAANKPAGNKPPFNKPAGNRQGPRPAGGPNSAQNVRKFPGNNASGGARNFQAPGGAANVPQRASGPVTKVTYNVVSTPSANANNASGQVKQAPVKKEGPQINRKPPAGGPAGPAGPRKNMQQPIKPNMPANKPPLSGRPNPRFVGQPADNQGNVQPMKLGYQKMPFDNAGNFGPAFGPSAELNNAGGNYGNFGGRAMSGNYSNMRNDINQAADSRDFRSNMRDDYRADTRDIRDIRDIRSIDLGGDNRGDAGFRSGFYRDMPGDLGRDARGDYGSTFRSDLPADSRSDMRSALVPDTRADIRSMARSEMAGDMRSYGNTDLRDLRNDARNDYGRERSTMSGYGASAAFTQQSYRSNDDYRSDSYGRGGQSVGQGQVTSSGNYPSGIMAGGRYDYMDRSSSSYNNQYGGSSRGIGYMGDMALNGR